jgi:hypothetical protein
MYQKLSLKIIFRNPNEFIIEKPKSIWVLFEVFVTLIKLQIDLIEKYLMNSLYCTINRE